jgi:hypothetical protein
MAYITHNIGQLYRSEAGQAIVTSGKIKLKGLCMQHLLLKRMVLKPVELPLLLSISGARKY